MITTADLQMITRPHLETIFAAFGHDLQVVTLARPGTWNTPSVTPPPGVPVRGLLLPVSDQRRQLAATSGLPVPQFEAYLPFDTPGLDTPGWYLTCNGQAYYPTRDARDEGGQGLVWVVELGAPGEVLRGDDQPRWTG